MAKIEPLFGDLNKPKDEIDVEKICIRLGYLYRDCSDSPLSVLDQTSQQNQKKWRQLF